MPICKIITAYVLALKTQSGKRQTQCSFKLKLDDRFVDYVCSDTLLVISTIMNGMIYVSARLLTQMFEISRQ